MIFIYYIVDIFLLKTLKIVQVSGRNIKIIKLPGFLWLINIANTESFQMVRHTLKILRHPSEICHFSQSLLTRVHCENDDFSRKVSKSFFNLFKAKNLFLLHCKSVD